MSSLSKKERLALKRDQQKELKQKKDDEKKKELKKEREIQCEKEGEKQGEKEEVEKEEEEVEKEEVEKKEGEKEGEKENEEGQREGERNEGFVRETKLQKCVQKEGEVVREEIKIKGKGFVNGKVEKEEKEEILKYKEYVALKQKINVLAKERQLFIDRMTHGGDVVYVYRNDFRGHFKGHNSTLLNNTLRKMEEKEKIIRDKREKLYSILYPVTPREIEERKIMKVHGGDFLFLMRMKEFSEKKKSVNTNKYTIERRSVGTIIGIYEKDIDGFKKGDVIGVRCYHLNDLEGYCKEYEECDCIRNGNEFTLSEKCQDLEVEGFLQIDESILNQQKNSVKKIGECLNIHSNFVIPSFNSPSPFGSTFGSRH